MSALGESRFAIEEEQVVELAVVEVTDGYGVELWQHQHRVQYTPQQAIELGQSLIAKGTVMRVALEEDTARERFEHGFDVEGPR